ncbi:MAG: porphobilinogen synthase [Coxiella sp. (in: Bacteria)]|nr:MAG: porphobilinogen synthase [Coxiella sp. (in: g-proteobacteria)]
MSHFPTTRLRRLRQHPGIRDLVREHELSPNDFVYPLFIKEGKGLRLPIPSMAGQFQLSVDRLEDEIAEITQLGIKAVLLFGIPKNKDPQGKCSWSKQGIIQQAIRKIKSLNSELLVIADVCFCEFTDHGHCGVIKKQGDAFELDNDATLINLAKQAVSFAEAGADVVAPSGMIDGMVGAVRQALDKAGFCNTPILSYSVKYASALYGPFREAAEGAPQFGDRRSYQMDCADGDAAYREVDLDLEEGADMLMVKPASYYLDVIYRIKQAYPGVPLCAYQVSGEYAMIKAASDNGWLDHDKVMYESLLAMKRAGADFIITYFAKSVCNMLN